MSTRKRGSRSPEGAPQSSLPQYFRFLIDSSEFPFPVNHILTALAYPSVILEGTCSACNSPRKDRKFVHAPIIKEMA